MDMQAWQNPLACDSLIICDITYFTCLNDAAYTGYISLS